MEKLPERGPVVLVASDFTWARVYAEQAERIHEALGGTVQSVEHIGSTAVPGLAAKPIVDLMAGVAPFEPPETYVARLGAAGFLHACYGDAPGRHFFLRTNPDCHLHIVEEGGGVQRRHLLFRDLLRKDPFLRREYEALKYDLAERFRNDRDRYAEAKTGFVEHALRFHQ